MYANLYGRLTELEVKTGSLERDLGDPARLLTELATDGFDLSSLLETPEAMAVGSSSVEIHTDSLEGDFANLYGDLNEIPEDSKDLISLDEAPLLGEEVEDDVRL